MELACKKVLSLTSYAPPEPKPSISKMMLKHALTSWSRHVIAYLVYVMEQIQLISNYMHKPNAQPNTMLNTDTEAPKTTTATPTTTPGMEQAKEWQMQQSNG